MRLSARLGNRVAGSGRHRALDHLLQSPAAPHCPWRTAARRGLLQPDRNRPAGAGRSLNHPEICPRIGEQLNRHEIRLSYGTAIETYRDAFVLPLICQRTLTDKAFDPIFNLLSYANSRSDV